MRLFSFFLFLLLCKIATSQDFPKTWGNGKEKTIAGHKILKEEGSGSPFIFWRSQGDYRAEVTERAKNEIWTQDSLDKSLKAIDENMKGGLLSLKVVRLTAESANLKHFTVIIFTLEGTELFRKQMESSVPTYEIIGANTFWTNYGSLVIPVELKTPFRIVIIDNLADDKRKKYSFQIKS